MSLSQFLVSKGGCQARCGSGLGESELGMPKEGRKEGRAPSLGALFHWSHTYYLQGLGKLQDFHRCYCKAKEGFSSLPEEGQSLEAVFAGSRYLSSRWGLLWNLSTTKPKLIKAPF